MTKVIIDNVEIEVAPELTLLQACEQAGAEIPRFCFHERLSIAGNCRMCLIEVKGGPPKPVASCAMNVRDLRPGPNGEPPVMFTKSPMVKKAREGVMEFLLINHPLDCPICDQAGECRLQEFSVEFGKGESRFIEEKVKKPKHVDIGERIVLDDERCIMCSRCIRFMQEVAHDDVLGFLNRGSHTTLSVYPGKRLDSNYSLNTVDICPVGALTSKDFRFKMRVWFLKETKSIDVTCGTGSNIVIWSRENIVHRITPRENDFVNSCWMPDSHRMNFHHLHSDARLQAPVVKGEEAPATWPRAIAAAAEQLRGRNPSDMAIIASARLSNEELFLVRRLAATLKIDNVDVLPRPQTGDGFLVSNDGNPNTTGAKMLGLATGKLPEIVQGVESGKISGLIVLGEDAVDCGISADSLRKLGALVVMGISANRTTEHATALLPSSAWAEKRGTMINPKVACSASIKPFSLPDKPVRIGRSCAT